MTRKRSARLQPLVRLAESKEQEAARVLGVYQHRLQEEQTKLGQLTTYREEYAEQFQRAGYAGMSVARMQDYRMMLARLDQAIEEQRKAVVRAENAVEEKRQIWLQTRGRTQALGKATARYRAQEARADEHKEQKDSDERSQRKSGSGGV